MAAAACHHPTEEVHDFHDRILAYYAGHLKEEDPVTEEGWRVAARDGRLGQAVRGRRWRGLLGRAAITFVMPVRNVQHVTR
jgi:hypothetical protein